MIQINFSFKIIHKTSFSLMLHHTTDGKPTRNGNAWDHHVLFCDKHLVVFKALTDIGLVLKAAQVTRFSCPRVHFTHSYTLNSIVLFYLFPLSVLNLLEPSHILHSSTPAVGVLYTNNPRFSLLHIMLDPSFPNL